MTLSISPTRSGLTTTIVCLKCEHFDAEPPPAWIDTNGDVYFQGESWEDLVLFGERHRE